MLTWHVSHTSVGKSKYIVIVDITMISWFSANKRSRGRPLKKQKVAKPSNKSKNTFVPIIQEVELENNQQQILPWHDLPQPDLDPLAPPLPKWMVKKKMAGKWYIVIYQNWSWCEYVFSHSAMFFCHTMAQGLAVSFLTLCILELWLNSAIELYKHSLIALCSMVAFSNQYTM